MVQTRSFVDKTIIGNVSELVIDTKRKSSEEKSISKREKDKSKKEKWKSNEEQ